MLQTRPTPQTSRTEVKQKIEPAAYARIKRQKKN